LLSDFDDDVPTDMSTGLPIMHRQIFANGTAWVSAATMVEVRQLIDPDLLVEIEVDAVIGSGDAR
jgi:enamine deaminase RidA (YjgF/YER057c/UK114 family)